MLEPPNQTEAAQIWTKADGLAWQIVGAEAIVLDMDRHMVRGINRTGWLIWELVDGTRSIGDIATRLAERYHLDGSRALNEVISFVQQLSQRQLIRRAS